MDQVLAERATIAPPSEAELVRGARAGDREAFDLLMTMRLDPAFRMAMAILGHEADARDATQESFVKAWRELRTLRDASRFGVMAVGMSFVIINRDLDLSVGSTLGLVAVVFALAVTPGFYELSPWLATLICLVVGTVVGLINGVLVTYLGVPAFIATLTMLFIGRGLVLGLTGGHQVAVAGLLWSEGGEGRRQRKSRKCLELHRGSP